MTTPKVQALLDKLPDGVLGGSGGKFAPKLTEKERYEVLAAVLAGAKRTQVAEAYGIDRRTVSHICNQASGHYKSTREMWHQMGTDDFLNHYFTEDVVFRLKNSYIPPSSANRRAVKHSGMHVINAPHLRAPHRVEIAFMEAGATGDIDAPEGWYYRDTSGPEPDEWYNSGPESLATSTACYHACVDELEDV